MKYAQCQLGYSSSGFELRPTPLQLSWERMSLKTDLFKGLFLLELGISLHLGVIKM